MSDEQQTEPPLQCRREGCEKRFWHQISVDIHLTTEHDELGGKA